MSFVPCFQNTGHSNIKGAVRTFQNIDIVSLRHKNRRQMSLFVINKSSISRNTTHFKLTALAFYFIVHTLFYSGIAHLR